MSMKRSEEKRSNLQRIREICKGNRVNESKLAQDIGCCRKSLYNWLKGDRAISLENAEKLLAALGYHIEIVKDE